MTTLFKVKVSCGACGHPFAHHVVISTNIFGSPDLDGRPPEMKRSTISEWVHRCPSCGYCAGEISKFDERFRAVMNSAAYGNQLADQRYPTLASSFICAAMLAEAGERRENAGWTYLHAAWALDDEGKDDLARMARNCAAAIFDALVVEGRPFATNPGASETVLADCLRRAGREPEALRVVDRALSQSYEEEIKKLLMLQQELIRRGDTGRHLVQEALGRDDRSAFSLLWGS
jgi:hypothetical protein